MMPTRAAHLPFAIILRLHIHSLFYSTWKSFLAARRGRQLPSSIMCLYQYLFYTTCQHAELTLITYCNKAKALGIPERDSLSRCSLNTGTGTDRHAANSCSPLPPTSSSANTHRAIHLHNQRDQHCNMTTLSPPKTYHMPCGSSVIGDTTQQSHQSAAHIPRSALAEADLLDNTPHTASLMAVQALEAFSAHNADDSTLALSKEGLQHVSSGTATSAIRLADDACNSDIETSQGTSESSIDIITERTSVGHGAGKATSPHAPLPARCLPSSTSPVPATAQADKSYGKSQVPSGGMPTDCGTLRSTQRSLDAGKSSVAKATFLTKEALDAVDANMTSPILRRSPSKMHQPHTKQPLSSSTVSPKMQSSQHSAASPTKPSPPPRTAPPGSHIHAKHRRAPSSVVSTGATTFYTAHGSPVRSIAYSQSNCSSAEDFHDPVQSDWADDFADIDGKQIEESYSSKLRTNTTGSPVKARARPSKPELSINIPTRDSALSADQTPVSAFTSATSSSGGASPRPDHLDVSSTSLIAMQSSRIPRISSTKISTARAPTLSSTLKQTKSAQTLRSPKASTGAANPARTPDSKPSSTKSPRHVRTLDSAGSTPVMLDRRTRNNLSKSASVTGFATTKAERTLQASEGGLHARGPSRATSASTITAAKNNSRPPTTGIVHSSDADDECDASTASTSSSAKDTPNSLPPRGPNIPHLRLATASSLSAHTPSTSDLRATAEEFVPAGGTTSDIQDVASSKFPLALPDLFALDGYGIPWYYHMYPVPYLFPPMYPKGQSKSPKRLRPRKQRSAPGDVPQGSGCGLSSLDFQTSESAAGASAAQSENISSGKAMHDPRSVATTSSAKQMATTAGSDKSAIDSFTSQFDEVAHQTARQTYTRKVRPPQDDLTTIRNVAARDTGDVQGYRTLPSRRRAHYHTGNGLYGGRGSVGVPLHATAPFPNPVPPMGRPADGYVGYNFGTGACGTIDIGKAFEHGGRQACNACEPDH